MGTVVNIAVNIGGNIGGNIAGLPIGSKRTTARH